MIYVDRLFHLAVKIKHAQLNALKNGKNCPTIMTLEYPKNGGMVTVKRSIGI